MINITINDEFNSFRIDKFLCKKFDISFALAQKLIREKKIKINQQKAEIHSKLKSGDEIIIHSKLNPRFSNLNHKDLKPKISLAKQQKFWENIIFEDENIVAINKPSGLATQAGSKIEISIDDFVKLKNYQLVHRLDKDTSGLLIIAKNNISAEVLSMAFKNKTINKTYIALIHGNLKKTSGIIDIPLSKKILGNIEKVLPDFESGKQAITNYKLIKQYPEYCEVELKPITGRTHQLRVHCKEIGHPILNDIKYGGKKVNYFDKFPHLCLHAYQIYIADFFGKDLMIKTHYPNFKIQ
jgi:23S rRNA pseudouridine955/2504/2580 synthase